MNKNSLSKNFPIQNFPNWNFPNWNYATLCEKPATSKLLEQIKIKFFSCGFCLSTVHRRVTRGVREKNCPKWPNTFLY
jgi:hypothetical protein